MKKNIFSDHWHLMQQFMGLLSLSHNIITKNKCGFFVFLFLFFVLFLKKLFYFCHWHRPRWTIYFVYIKILSVVHVSRFYLELHTLIFCFKLFQRQCYRLRFLHQLWRNVFFFIKSWVFLLMSKTIFKGIIYTVWIMCRWFNWSFSSLLMDHWK